VLMAHFDDQLPDDVRDIAERLSMSRATFTPLELDELRHRLQKRAQRAPSRRGLLGRMHAKWVAVLLAAGLLLSSGAGVVIACESVGGDGGQTFGTTSFHDARDASFCEYHGPYTKVVHIHTRRGDITITIVWDCRHVHVHFDHHFPFNWRFGDGGWNDGRLIGWPACKEYIPLDFSRTQFPGGYPNDNGVNIMHDDFFGSRQPETQALFDLAARERPDLILNLHTGAGANDYYTRMHIPVMEEVLRPAFNGLYRAVHTALVHAGFQGSSDLGVEADPGRTTSFGYNLDSALDFHCGALSVVVESPSHGYSGRNQRGDVVRHLADQLLDEQLLVQQEAMRYLVDAGGRARWAGGK